MSEASQNISVELPEHLLKKLGDDPSSKIRELLEKYVEQKSVSRGHACVKTF